MNWKYKRFLNLITTIIVTISSPTTSFLTSVSRKTCYDSPYSLKSPTCYMSVSLPEPNDSKFGRQDYWNQFYEEQQEEGSFSWYSNWNELEPFCREILGEPYNDQKEEQRHVLVPGVGNDALLKDMYDSGYKHITAFDYAAAGVECQKQLLGSRLSNINLVVADARNLPFSNSSFDSVIDKGTLDAIYLSGGNDKVLGQKHLNMAVSELARVLKPNGIVLSISAACVDAVQSSFQESINTDYAWKQICDGSFYITDDGYTSNNIDGTLLAWKRLENE